MKTWARFDFEGSPTGTVAEIFSFGENPHALFPPEWVWVEAPDDTVQGATFDGEIWKNPAAPPPPPPLPAPTTEQMVDAERDRRIGSDITYQGVVYQADETAQRRIEKARISALAAVTAGAQRADYRWHGQNVDFTWIAKSNARVKMDAQTVLDFGNTLAAREGMLIMAGSDIKNRIAAGEVITDLGDDGLW